MGIGEFVGLKLGTLINVINSGINFGIYIYLPLLIGVDSYSSFQLNNVMPSLIIVFFSPSIPYLVKNRNIALMTFLVALAFISVLLFFFSSLCLVASNISWILYGLITMNLYFNHSKMKFYLYTISLTILQLLLLYIFKDYLKSFVSTSFLSVLVIFIVERKSVKSLFRDIDLSLSLDVLYALLKPFFSIGFFWQVVLLVISECSPQYFLSITYYSKISLSVAVALFSIVSLDLMHKKTIEKHNIVFLCILCVVLINSLIFFLDFFGKQVFAVNSLYASILLILSVAPTISFNLVSDTKFYRYLFVISLLLTIFLLQFSDYIYLTIGWGLCMISLTSYLSYRRLPVQDALTS